MTSGIVLALLLGLGLVGSAYGQDDRVDLAAAGGNYAVVFYGDEGITSRGELTNVQFSRGVDGTSGDVTGSYTGVIERDDIEGKWHLLSNGVLVVNFSTVIPDAGTFFVGILVSTDSGFVIRGHSEFGTIAGPVDGGAFQARRSE